MLDFKKEFIALIEKQAYKRIDRKNFTEYRMTLHKQVEEVVSNCNELIPEIEFIIASTPDNSEGISVKVQLNEYNLADRTYLHYKPNFKSLNYDIEYTSMKNSKLEDLSNTSFKAGKITPQDIQKHLLDLIKLEHYNEIHFY